VPSDQPHDTDDPDAPGVLDAVIDHLQPYQPVAPASGDRTRAAVTVTQRVGRASRTALATTASVEGATSGTSTSTRVSMPAARSRAAAAAISTGSEMACSSRVTARMSRNALRATFVKLSISSPAADGSDSSRNRGGQIGCSHRVVCRRKGSLRL
jgi:hypothetical protein